MGGKVGSWVDEGGNHIEMGLHVFFFNYTNLFALMRKVGAFDNLLPKDHTHLFVNEEVISGSWISALPSALRSTSPQGLFTTPQPRLDRQAAQCPGSRHQPDRAEAWWITRGDAHHSRPGSDQF